MLAFAHVMHFFAHELAGLRRGRLAGALVPSSALERLLFWHRRPPEPRIDATPVPACLDQVAPHATCRMWMSTNSAGLSGAKPTSMSTMPLVRSSSVVSPPHLTKNASSGVLP